MAATSAKKDTKKTAAVEGPSAGELLERAKKLVPAFRERAVRTHAERRVPEESIRDLMESGILFAGAPKRFGGSELGLDSVGKIITEIGKGCGSTAWIQCILGGSAWTVSLFPEQAQEDFFKSDTPIACGTIGPTGSVTPVDGGYKLQGQWHYGSGIDHAGWNTVGGLVFDEAVGKMDMRLFLVPKSDYTVIDNWHTTGMRGTGSKSLEIKEAFVPEYRSVGFEGVREGTSPGAKLHNSLTYKVPYLSVNPLVFPILGMAQGALEYWTEWTKGRWGVDGSRTAEKPFTQLHLTQVAAELDAAQMVVDRLVADPLIELAAGRTYDAAKRTRNQRDAAYVADVCRRAVERLIEAAGTSGLNEKSPLERLWRDIHFGSSHISLRLDHVGIPWAQVALGLKYEPSLFY